MVFFPHGNLCLARDLAGQETKISTPRSSTANFNSLLPTITAKWRSSQHVPIFVSEGTSTQKMLAIRRSHYLSVVYDDVFSSLGRSGVVFYGLSFSANDSHILLALSRSPPSQIAIFVYTGQSTANQQQFCYHALAQIRQHQALSTTPVHFFDSASPSVWANP